MKKHNNFKITFKTVRPKLFVRRVNTSGEFRITITSLDLSNSSGIFVCWLYQRGRLFHLNSVDIDECELPIFILNRNKNGDSRL